MVLHEDSMYARLHKLAIVRYGYTSEAFTRVIKDVLLNVWCHETTRPDFVAEWRVMHPAMGQSDVTSYYLAKYVFDGCLVGVNLYEDKEAPYFAVWNISAGMTCIYDFCSNWMRRAPRIFTSWEPDDFLELSKAQVDGQVDLEFDRRLALFSERFESVVRALEHPVCTSEG